MAAKPIKIRELDYPMLQFLIFITIMVNGVYKRWIDMHKVRFWEIDKQSFVFQLLYLVMTF